MEEIDILDSLLEEIELQRNLADEFSVIRFVQLLSDDDYTGMMHILPRPEGRELLMAFLEVTPYKIEELLKLVRMALQFRKGAIQLDLSKGERNLKRIPFSRN